MISLETLLVFLIIPATISCCDPQSNVASCWSNSVYILDLSADMETHAYIDTEVDFVRDRVYTGINFGYGTSAFIGYGAGPLNFQPPTHDLTNACFQLEILRTMADGNGLQNVTLLGTLQSFAFYYANYTSSGLSVTLFSRSNDGLDITAASNYARSSLSNVQFTVVVLDDNSVNSAWTNFPAIAQFNVPIEQLSKKNSTNNLDRCLILRNCGTLDDCGYPDVVNPTTGASTMPVIATTPGGAPYHDLDGPSCSCNMQTSYNDVMIVVDNSQGMGEIGLTTVLGTISTELAFFNILPASFNNLNNSTRVGVVTYASTAVLYQGLGTMTAQDVHDLYLNLDVVNDPFTNVNEGLNLAINEFAGPNARNTSRPVIILVASVYTDNGFADPVKASIQFQQSSGGVVIVYEFIQPFGQKSPQIKPVASPGYYLNNIDNTTGDEISVGLCDANCFCQSGLLSFKRNADRNLPTAGCYFPMTAGANYDIARGICKKSFGGDLATDFTAEKSNFLVSGLNVTVQDQALIGLKFNTTLMQWIWDDGQVLNASYQPWFGGPPSNVGNNQCVLMFPPAAGAVPVWMNTNCAGAKRYMCQMHPSDSTYFFPAKYS